MAGWAAALPLAPAGVMTLPGSLVDPAWLAAHLGAPGLLVFDATKFLPSDAKDGQHEFYGGHVPGARFFDIDLFADPETELPHMVPSQGRFSRMAGAAGIGPASAVVFYDQKGQASAARGWWLLRLFGQQNVALLDGGLPRWWREGYALEMGLAPAPPPTLFLPRFYTEGLVGLGDMLSNIATQEALVLDARPAPRFAGTAAEPRPGIAPGHIPGSRNLPFTDLLDPDGNFLPVLDLRARFARAGVDGSRPVITTCGTGVTAAILAFAMHLAGLPDAAVYDGSWTEWGSRADTPKELGDA